MDSAHLTPSQEDYLEAVYRISEEKKAARAKDIADRLNVRASSVTAALRTLAALELVHYAPYDLITLTDLGLAAARDIVARHDALCDFFITVLGVDPDEADQAACRMEHTVPKTIVERLVRYADYVKHCPRGGITWDSGFGYYCKHGCTDQGCSRNLPGADEPGR